MDPDLRLIQRLQAGEDAALNELIVRYREPLFHFVFLYLRNTMASHEVVQETFVRVYFKANKYTPHSTVKTWIYTIALNLCRDQGRRMLKRQRDVSLNAPRSGGLPPIELADTSLSPGEQVVLKDQFVELHRAIERLPHKLKTAIVLFSLGGLSQREVADILGTTLKTVETRVHYAKDRLRKILSQ